MKSISYLFSASYLIATCASFSSFAQIPGLVPEKNWDLGGYIKYMATFNAADSSSTHLTDHLLHQRFNFEYRFSSALRANVSMRNRFIWGDSVTNNPNYGSVVGQDDGFFDLTSNWHDNGRQIGTTQFDRAYLDYSGSEWRARAGRFRINWAMTTIWNPNDIYNTYSIYDFDYEEKGGADALQLSRSLGYASSFDVVYSPSEDDDQSSYSARYLGNDSSWDYQLMVGKAKLDSVIGAGFAGDIKGAGVRGEVSYFSPTKEKWKEIELTATIIASVEVDYSFGGRRNWLGRVATLYISEPQEPNSAPNYLNKPTSPRTMSFDEHTAYADLGFDVSPLMRLTFSSTLYGEGSLFLGANTSYSISDEAQLIGVIQRFDGRENSLFGKTSGTAIYAQIKWSF